MDNSDDGGYNDDDELEDKMRDATDMIIQQSCFHDDHEDGQDPKDKRCFHVF